MKREREVEEMRPQIGPNNVFRISPESTYSINNTHNNIANGNLVTKATNLEDDDNNNINNNKEQDRFLPIANVGRIMKKVIPGNGKISKDAKETVQECVSEFISFVTGEASEKCQREKRKTINGDDVLWAIMTLGFEDYVNPLKLYIAKYREVEGEKLNVPKQQRAEQPLQHEQKPYNSMNIISQTSFSSADPPFPLSFSQNSVPHNHFGGNW